MASSQKGKFFIFSMLFFFSSLHGFSAPIEPQSCSIQSKLDPDSCQEHVPEQPQKTNHLNQQVLLDKLEELVRNLSDIVARLESKLPDPPREKGRLTQIKGGGDGDDARSSSKGVEDGEFGEKVRDGERARGMSVTKYTPFWSERFQFASAVKLDSDATCINVLPFRDHEGLSKYVAVSDKRGRVYVFLRNGDVLVEFDTSLESPITAMVSYTSVYKNESFVVTGHENGEILVHRVWEGGSSGEDYSSLFMENVGKFVSPENREDGLPVTLLEVHYVGRMKYILSADTSGKIKVFKENGSLYGSATPSSRPLVFLKQRLMFLTETGAGSLDLRGMKIRESECEGLNHSVAQSYVFDAMERSKAYGFTSDGDLINVLLLGDVMNFKCRVRYKKKFDVDEPLALQAIKGYLLIVNPEKVFVYNVSSPHYVRVGVPRPVFSSSLDELRSSFLNHPTPGLDAETRVIPLIASDREKLVIVGLGGGYVGMYHSNLPIFKGEFNTMLWTSPVLFFILFLFGAWHFFAKKKEALTSWGPDDPFSSTSATTGAPLASGSVDRSFVDSSSRSTEVMDLRGGNLRAPPRRYGSPSRYPGGAASSYRLGASADHNARPASVDPDFRAASELKFRASTMDPPGFPKRRDGMFVGNQVVNDRS
ncbi:membrane protein [Spatholobus suberectus]|nr:membrane protein [Spatholobus suberectus]